MAQAAASVRPPRAPQRGPQQRQQKQSRIGKRPIPVPQGVSVSVQGRKITVKGPKGTSERTVHEWVTVTQKDGSLHIALKPSPDPRALRFQGLSYALLRNMVHGVSQGYALSLDLHGVGYRAELSGKNLTLSLGLSHQVKVTLPDAIAGRVEIIDEAGQKRPRLHLSSHDKEALGQTAARIRSYRPPEPYKGKGIRYTGERIREKAGKAAAKGKK